jgi:hypothetical protein
MNGQLRVNASTCKKAFQNSELDGIYGSFDSPKSGPLNVLYNPLASLWHEYRNLQATQFQTYFMNIAHANQCQIDKSMFFSHQILPHAFSSFSRKKLGLDDDSDFFHSSNFQQGVNVYGPETYSDSFFEYTQKFKWNTYGIGEFHPQTALPSTESYIDMFKRHRAAGARYISPYYMSTSFDPKRSRSEVEAMCIHELNTQKGSDSLYNGIKKLMAEY